MNAANASASSGSSFEDPMNQNGNSSMADPDASCGSSGSVSKKKGEKKQQYTSKQRIDMYAFCVLEIESNSNKVSIKKQQMAFQKALRIKQEQGQTLPTSNNQQLLQPNNGDACNGQAINNHTNNISSQEQTISDSQKTGLGTSTQNDIASSDATQKKRSRKDAESAKTFLELKEELSFESYSDYQKVQVLTTSMLRNVQNMFTKYYPDLPTPSRTTIKHVFEKCVQHGTVDNIKTEKKLRKIPQGDEITSLLFNEPQMSLRQMARKLNVSTGTVSRRCKALGLVPDSVTTKHHQMAIAKRQKQMKLMANERGGSANTNNLSKANRGRVKQGNPQEH